MNNMDSCRALAVIDGIEKMPEAELSDDERRLEKALRRYKYFRKNYPPFESKKGRCSSCRKEYKTISILEGEMLGRIDFCEECLVQYDNSKS